MVNAATQPGGLLPDFLLGFTRTSPPFALLDASNAQDAVGWTCLLYDLEEQVVCKGPWQVTSSLHSIDACRARGLYVLCMFNYELGYALHSRLTGLASRAPELFRAFAFRRRADLAAAQVHQWLYRYAAAAGEPCGIAGLRPSLSAVRYAEQVERIQDYIVAGDCYQVNLTYTIDFDSFGDPLALYRELREQQKVSYGVFVALQDGYILSFSPELFVRRRGTTLTAKPMKGTIRRGSAPAEDDALRDTLAHDVKNRAEHVMIVDLLRNDLGRLARIGGVQVDRLFEIEDYRTLFQMTSTIRAETDGSVPLDRVLEALFPCGSVTGAPKLRAMEIIAETESRPRGLYCGAIGTLDPDGDFCFNVPIRTLVLDGVGRGSVGVGSAIVYDSDAVDEYAECNLKASFITGLDPGFHLIETMKCDEAGFANLELHLGRLAASASYFGFACDCATIRADLEKLRAEHARSAPWRARVLLSKSGEVRLERRELHRESARHCLTLSTRQTNSHNILLRHKTTARQLYDDEFARAQAQGYCDALFINERGEITEASRANVFVKLGGAWYTPPVSSGLLAGVMRRLLLADPRYGARERVIYLDDVSSAECILLTNSVRGVFEVKIVFAPLDCVASYQNCAAPRSRRR